MTAEALATTDNAPAKQEDTFAESRQRASAIIKNCATAFGLVFNKPEEDNLKHVRAEMRGGKYTVNFASRLNLESKTFQHYDHVNNKFVDWEAQPPESAIAFSEYRNWHGSEQTRTGWLQEFLKEAGIDSTPVQGNELDVLHESTNVTLFIDTAQDDFSTKLERLIEITREHIGTKEYSANATAALGEAIGEVADKHIPLGLDKLPLNPDAALLIIAAGIEKLKLLATTLKVDKSVSALAERTPKKLAIPDGWALGLLPFTA